MTPSEISAISLHDALPILEWLRQRWINREMSDEQRSGLEKWYGAERAAEFRYAESFEIAEYGRYPTEEEIRMIFPMLGNRSEEHTSELQSRGHLVCRLLLE